MKTYSRKRKTTTDALAPAPAPGHNPSIPGFRKFKMPEKVRFNQPGRDGDREREVD